MTDKLLIDRATIAQVREALKASGCVAFEGLACRCNAPCSSYTADVALRAALARQPEPLTDEEIRAHADKHLRYQPESYEASGVFDLARAIKAVEGEKT